MFGGIKTVGTRHEKVNIIAVSGSTFLTNVAICPRLVQMFRLFSDVTVVQIYIQRKQGYKNNLTGLWRQQMLHKTFFDKKINK